MSGIPPRRTEGIPDQQGDEERRRVDEQNGRHRKEQRGQLPEHSHELYWPDERGQDGEAEEGDEDAVQRPRLSAPAVVGCHSAGSDGAIAAGPLRELPKQGIESEVDAQAPQSGTLVCSART